MLLVKGKLLRILFGALETFSWLSLKLLFKGRGAYRVFPGMVFRTYMSLARDGRWKSRAIHEVIATQDIRRISIEHLPGGGVNTSAEELVFLAMLAQSLHPEAVFEIGTFRGRTALNFALNSPPECKVYTLDLPSDARTNTGLNCADAGIVARSLTGIDYQGRDVTGKIVQLWGDSTQFDFGPYGGRMDLVFVDGAHHYSAALSDTQNALRLVKPGGLIVWHDFANYGDYNDVTRAVLDCIPGDEVVQIESSQLAVYRKPKDFVPAPTSQRPPKA